MMDAARLQELREQCSGHEAPGDGTYLKDSELSQLLDDLVEQRKTISALMHRIELTERDWRMEKERRIALPFVHADGSDCPTFYDGCNCSLEVLRDQITRAEHAEKAMEDAALALGVALGDPKVCWSDLPRLATWAADILSGPLSGAVKAEREVASYRRTLELLAEHEPSWADDFCRARAALGQTTSNEV